MATLVRLPQLAENVDEATIGAWRLRAGEPVSLGQPLMEIITSKATFDLESPAEGILREVCAPEKGIVPVGYILAIIGTADEPLPRAEVENERLMAEFRGRVRPEVVRTPAGVRATPGARRLARESGIAIEAVPPEAGKDVIREEDVLRFLKRTGGGR